MKGFVKRLAVSILMLTTWWIIIIQYIYTETQMLVSRIDAVYGAFAAIPLFLIWLNISWMVILIGAEISHAFQYVSEYRLKKNEV